MDGSVNDQCVDGEGGGANKRTLVLKYETHRPTSTISGRVIAS